MSNHSLFHQGRKCFAVWGSVLLYGISFEFNNAFSDISLAKDSFKKKFSKMGGKLPGKVIILIISISEWEDTPTRALQLSPRFSCISFFFWLIVPFTAPSKSNDLSKKLIKPH